MTVKVIFCDSSLKEFCLKEIDKEPIVFAHIEPVTVNVGEYRAVVYAFQTLISDKIKEALVYTDSQIVVFQVHGIDQQGRLWKKCKPHLQPYRDLLRTMLDNN